MDNNDKTLRDAWLFDVTNRKWKEVSLSNNQWSMSNYLQSNVVHRQRPSVQQQFKHKIWILICTNMNEQVYNNSSQRPTIHGGIKHMQMVCIREPRDEVITIPS